MRYHQSDSFNYMEDVHPQSFKYFKVLKTTAFQQYITGNSVLELTPARTKRTYKNIDYNKIQQCL